MRSLITAALAVVATSSLIGWGTAANASEPTITQERGILIECTGTWRGEDVFASLYENKTYGNTMQVVIGDGDVAGGSRETTHAFKVGRDVRGAMQLNGRRVVIEGIAKAVGRKVAVHEEHDDAGQHIIIDGTHRRLANDLTLTWKGTTVPLGCDNAFAYDLRVSKESTTGN